MRHTTVPRHTTANAFSDVDASGRADDLVQYLDHADRGLRGPKETLRAGFDVPAGGRVLDIGCGAGHELVQLVRDGFCAVGVDSSAKMLHAAQERLDANGHATPLVLGEAERLPFTDASFDGCRIERVLQHVRDPAAVIRQAHRVLQPCGRIAILEPDWASFTLAATDTDAARAIADAVGADIAHRDIGRHLRRLLVEAGFDQLRIDVELVVHSSLEDLSNMVSLERAAVRACWMGRLDHARAEALVSEQQRLSAEGAFHATINRSVLAWARKAD